MSCDKYVDMSDVSVEPRLNSDDEYLDYLESQSVKNKKIIGGLKKLNK